MLIAPIVAAQLHAAPEPRACAVPRTAPSAAGVSPARVQEFVDSARATGSDALVILISATKSIVGLAIGRLLHDGLIDSLDQPVWTIYPEWRQGRKRRITIRHLLSQTSGLQDVRGLQPPCGARSAL